MPGLLFLLRAIYLIPLIDSLMDELDHIVSIGEPTTELAVCIGVHKEEKLLKNIS